MKARYRFDYPAVFKTMPDYTAHAGQIVEVVRPLCTTLKHSDDGEFDFEGDAMFLIRAADGWEGHAWRSELVKVAPEPELVIDGHEYPDPESSLAGDGEYPPFYVFSVPQQKNVAGPFNTREEVGNWLLERI